VFPLLSNLGATKQCVEVPRFEPDNINPLDLILCIDRLVVDDPLCSLPRGRLILNDCSLPTNQASLFPITAKACITDFHMTEILDVRWEGLLSHSFKVRGATYFIFD